jgi:hypothetical protein
MHGRKMVRPKTDQIEAFDEGRDASRAAALEIIRLCAGRPPELVCGFLADWLTVDQVRAILAAYDRPN